MKRLRNYISFIFILLFSITDSGFSQPSVYKVEKLPFTSSVFNDIAPVVIKDGILFCSDRKTSSFRNGTTYQDERLYKIFVAVKKDTSKWRQAEEIKGVGSSMVYYGPVSLAHDGKTIYFTSSIISGKAARKKNINNPRGIFIGELSGTTIINIRPFEYNNTQYSVAHPSISNDGKYLFFASDMPGGQGGSDLYFCENTNGKWGAPVNLGRKVNSPSKENYPFIHPSGRLYFTSDRPGNADFLGGMDIYYTTLVLGEWDSPVPLPAPINSKSDDFAFNAEDNLQKGYFARNTGRNDNIFQFASTIIRKLSCDSLQINDYCYEFLEENAAKSDSLATAFRYQWNFGDGLSADGVRVIHCFAKPGTYRISLDAINLITKEITRNEKSYELEITDIEQPYITSPDRCNTGQQIKLNADSTNLPGWTINTYYWNFGDETIGLGREVDKVYTRQGVYNIQLIVTGAPDASGKMKEACVSKNINVIR
jgi:hypothetical protein